MEIYYLKYLPIMHCSFSICLLTWFWTGRFVILNTKDKLHLGRMYLSQWNCQLTCILNVNFMNFLIFKVFVKFRYIVYKWLSSYFLSHLCLFCNYIICLMEKTWSCSGYISANCSAFVEITNITKEIKININNLQEMRKTFECFHHNCIWF